MSCCEEKDLFNHIETLPENVQRLIESYGNKWDYSYRICSKMQEDLEALGYTFDYYLDAQPYNLRLL